MQFVGVTEETVAKPSESERGKDRLQRDKRQLFEVSVTNVPAPDADDRIAKAISLILRAFDKKREHSGDLANGEKRE